MTYTARGDGQGLDEVFEEVVYTRALPELIDDGYLAPLRGFRISTTADLRKLSPAGLDYDEFEDLVDSIARTADRWDDELAAK